ncbi:hypothetical protein OAG36_00705 [bacterium]|nr:hypothetical protein [bacterium]
MKPGLTIHEKTIEYYLERIHNKQYFAFPGYSDAEWFCILQRRLGHGTGLGQIIDKDHGLLLAQTLARRQHDPRWLWAIPKCLWELPDFYRRDIERFLAYANIDIEAYERDMVTDDLAESASLYPLIETARSMRTVLIGNYTLEPVAELLHTRDFVGVTSPNLHMTSDGIDFAVSVVQSLNINNAPNPSDTLYLVSAGVSAAIIIDKLYDKFPDNYYFDCGSMWDAFVGIGGQRTWRTELYNNETNWEQWKNDNLNGKQRD